MTEEITLNEGQQAACDGFFQFLFDKTKELILSGPGGVGKTFVMGQMIDVIMPAYFDSCKMMGIEPEFDDVQMCATTNKAAEVLSLATGRPCQTIHSYMNLKVTDDFSTGRSKITQTRNWVVHHRKIIFIDECSMIDSPLDHYIQEGTQDCKIVYVGDHCQIAPVMEAISPIYRRDIPFFELTEPMRTDVPELQALNEQLRKVVETGEFTPIKIIPGIIDLLNDEEMEVMIEQNFKEQTLGDRILAYTNDRVIAYNDHIRTLRNLPNEYVVGEYLINNSAIRLKQAMLSVEEEVQIIHMDDKSQFIEIGTDVNLEVRNVDLKTRIGNVFTDVPLPVDRGHFLSLIKYYANRKAWSTMYLLKNTYPDLRQRDAGTFFKAQGSTLDNVFIDAANLSGCTNPSQAARQLYVGASRARKHVYFYGNLAEKYGGLIR